MADDQKKDTPAGDKKVEAPKTLEEAIAKLTEVGGEVEKLRGQLKETTEESIKRKEKLRAIEQEKTDKEAAALKEKGEFKTLVDQLEPKAKRADELEKALKGYFDLEVAEVPEEKRTLIPAGPVETQLTWLKTAKASGIFGAPKKDPPPKSQQGKPGEEGTAEFLSYAPTDPRLTSLSREDYAKWKKHNGRDGSGVSAGGGAAWGSLKG